METKKIFLFSLLSSVFITEFVSAHCPLCTIGAGAAAGAAVYLGVSKIVVALFIGAFAMSMGMWFSRAVKKQYIQFQKTIIIVLILLTTIFPLMPLFSTIGPLYLPFVGDYGRTFAVDYALASSFLGALLVFISPQLSKKITKIRNEKFFPFQGVIITLSLLIIFAGIIQLII